MADIIVPEVIYTPDKPWSDAHAKEVVLRDFQSAEAYRTSNHESRWQNAQMLYVAWVKKRNWEGTRIPRAAIPVFLVFEQVEAVIPRVLSEVFADPQWFEAFPLPGTDPQVSRDVQALMLYQGDQMRIREQYRRGLKSALIYGNGILELAWNRSSIGHSRWESYEDPIIKPIPMPPFGMPRPTVVGMKSGVRRIPWTENVNRPEVRYVSLMDFYIDPNCSSPLVSDARFVVRRGLKTIDELLALKDQPGFNIPTKERLLELAKGKASTQGDVTKGQAESSRMGWWQPSVDTSADPAAARVEVLAYQTRDRIVWLAGREEVIFNSDNELGVISYYNISYADVLDRFYSLAMSDVLEGEQKLQEGIIDARLDELSISIHTPVIKKRGVAVSPYQLRRRPDQVIEADDAKDIIPSFPQNITQQSFIEIQASDNRAQKATGVSDLAVLGTPTGGGNSANRTATGVNQQASAATSRIRALVECLEYNTIEPMLNDWHLANTLWLEPEQISEVLGPGNALVNVQNINVMNARMKFSMRASARMRSKAAMMQNFGQLMQTFMNPAFMQELAKQQQKTVNLEELSQLLFDAIDYPARKSIFRDLSPQEMQAMNAPPQDAVMKEKMQNARLESAGENMEMKMTGDIVKEVVKAAVQPKEEKKEEKKK